MIFQSLLRALQADDIDAALRTAGDELFAIARRRRQTLLGGLCVVVVMTTAVGWGKSVAERVDGAQIALKTMVAR
jgi:hypothetical protein